jgi:ribosomal protein S18 acetylase RimI-like enzyme
LAGAADIPEIVRITNLAYRVEAFCLAGDRTDPKDVGELMAAGEFWVLDGAPGRLRGSVYLKPAGDRGYLGLLAVDPEAQGQGWSRLLVAAGEQRCQAAGCRFLDLTVVNLREELFGFYQKLGFVAGDTLPFPRPAKMILDCRLIRFTKPLRPLPAST